MRMYPKILPVRLTYQANSTQWQSLQQPKHRMHTTVGLTVSSIMGNTVGRRIYKDSNHTEIVGSVLQGGQIFNYGG